MSYKAAVHAISAQAFVRVEWSPDWSILVRQVLIPLALLTGLLWGGATGELDTILKQILE